MRRLSRARRSSTRSPSSGCTLYADFGLTFVKLGEEARVPLPHFSLEGSGHKKLRHDPPPPDREGVTLRVVEPAEVRPAARGAREVSDAWLRRQGGGREGLLAGLLRRRLPETASRWRCWSAARSDRGLRQPVAGRPASRALVRPHAVPADAPPRASWTGLFAQLLVWGRRGRLPAGSTWGWRRCRAWRRRPVAPLWMQAGPLRLRARGGLLQLPGPARLQGASSTRCGSPGTWPTPADWPCRASSPTSRRSSPAAIAGSS